MSKLKIDLDNIRFAVFKQIFEDIEVTFEHFNVEFYVIGALARDMIFSTVTIETRTTADVDLAIYIEGTEEQYQEIKAHLFDNYGFTQSSENAFTLISSDQHTLDLLPFGKIEVEDGVIISGKGLVNIKVNGFKEVFEEGLVKLEANDGKTFSASSLSSIILLKFLAFDDRPEMRGKDPGDVSSIIRYFFDLNASNIYDNHNDLFADNDGEEDYELEYVSAQVIGREINQVSMQTHELNERIISIIEDHIKRAERSSFIRTMVGDYCNSIDLAVTWLNFILKGIKEKGD